MTFSIAQGSGSLDLLPTSFDLIHWVQRTKTILSISYTIANATTLFILFSVAFQIVLLPKARNHTK
jgi:hypothetical protein